MPLHFPAQPWRAEIMTQLDVRELSAAMEGEDPAEWLHAVMVSGLPEAQIRLGRCHDNGWGTRPATPYS